MSRPASATVSTMTTKLPSRHDTRRAQRPVPAPPGRRSAATPTLHKASPITPGTLSSAELHGRMSYRRSASLTEESVATEARTARRVVVRSLSSSETPALSPTAASPPLHRAPSPPPPALPPRVPLRRRARGPVRQRCASEAQQSVELAAPSLPRSTSETVTVEWCSELERPPPGDDGTGQLNDSVVVVSHSGSDDEQPRPVSVFSTFSLHWADNGSNLLLLLLWLY